MFIGFHKDITMTHNTLRLQTAAPHCHTHLEARQLEDHVRQLCEGIVGDVQPCDGVQCNDLVTRAQPQLGVQIY